MYGTQCRQWQKFALNLFARECLLNYSGNSQPEDKTVISMKMKEWKWGEKW
jgi:hypothetical protein